MSIKRVVEGRFSLCENQLQNLGYILFTIFWTCTSGPCHIACGFVNIGTIRTNGSGKGKFKYKGPIPLSGKVHFDVLYSGNYYAGEFAAPSDADLIEASEDVIEGDPTLQ